MSRIGRKSIDLPKGVDLQIGATEITVKGPKGSLVQPALDGIGVAVTDGRIEVTRSDDRRRTRAFHGLMCAVLNNMVHGVSNGFEKKLAVKGTGYRAEVKGDILEMALGFSHAIRFSIPTGIKIEVDRNNVITVAGIDKVLVGETAAKIRRYRPPDAYKGKGVRYLDEYIKLKAGKSGS